MSEAALLKAFIDERSETAFASLVHRYAGLVFSTAHRRLGNPALAEDITQLVFIRLSQKPPTLRTSAELAAWLHRTTVHVTIDQWRAETRRRVRELESTLMEANPANSVVWEEISPKLDDALNELRDDDRQVLTLRFFSGKSMREVGALLGVTEDAAKMRVSRAVERLRTRLGVAAAACPATALALLLGERAAEAASAPLLTKLAAIKLPAAAAGTAVAGGILARLLQGAKWKWAAGAVGILLVGASLYHFGRSPDHGDARAALQSNTQPFPTVSRAQYDHMAHLAEAARDNWSPAHEPNVKMLLRVLDSRTSQPLANTQVHVAAFGPGGHGESQNVTSDATGIARILESSDPSKKDMNVFTVAEAHVPKAIRFANPQSPTNYTVLLDPATNMSGIIVDDALQPLPGVRLELEGPSANLDGREDVDFQTCPVTNQDDGTWSFGYLPFDYTNTVRLTLKKDGYAATHLTVPIHTLGRSNLVLSMKRGYSVSGRIIDTQEKPIPNASVRILTGNRALEKTAKTDPEGRFLMTGVAGEPREYSTYLTPPALTDAHGRLVIQEDLIRGPYQVRLSVQSPGFASQTNLLGLESLTNSVEIRLSPGKTLKGHIVDSEGNPIANAIAQTDWNDQAIRVYEWTSHTDAQGRFEWNSMSEGTVLFWFEAEGYAPQRMIPLSADDTDHEIQLQRPNEARGRRGGGSR